MNTDHLDGVLDQFTLEQRKAAVDELGRLLDAAVQPNGMELLAAFLNDLHDERLSWYGEPDEAGRASCCPDAEPCPDAASITDTLLLTKQGQPEVTEATSPYWRSTGATTQTGHAMTTPGSVADWMQASVMAAALAGLAATSRSALREADADAPSSRRLGPSRPPSGPVEATAATEDAEAVRSVPAPTVRREVERELGKRWLAVHRRAVTQVRAAGDGNEPPPGDLGPPDRANRSGRGSRRAGFQWWSGN